MNSNPTSEINISKETSSSIDLVSKTFCTNERISFGRRLKVILRHFISRQFMLFCLILSTLAKWIGRKKLSFSEKGCVVMLTGRFDSKNWILAHLVPIANSKKCSRILMVSSNPVPSIQKVEAIYPPKWLIKVTGKTPARLLTFFWAAIRKKPHFVGGFHLLYNGIFAEIISYLVGARSIYFCIGGTEVDNQGVMDEPNCFKTTKAADNILRKRRLKIVSRFDLIITMGTRAAKFLRKNGINTTIKVVSGGIDTNRFHPGKENPLIDIIFVARLSIEKRLDIFLQAVKLVVDELPKTKVVIIGEGPLRNKLDKMLIKLSLDKNVDFMGHQDNVHEWLQQAKIFVLTSDLEGLALSVIEAMMSGLPVVVSDVGDLGDIVKHEVNGYLVPRRHPELFAKYLVDLLSNKKKLEAFGKTAIQSAKRYETQATSQKWDNIFESFQTFTKEK